MLIFVRNSKGLKDRYTILSTVALDHLRIYINKYHPEPWLFPGQDENYHLSERSAQRIFYREFMFPFIISVIHNSNLRIINHKSTVATFISILNCEIFTRLIACYIQKKYKRKEVNFSKSLVLIINSLTKDKYEL